MANEATPKAAAPVKYRLKGDKKQVTLPNLEGITITNENLNSDPRKVSILIEVVA